MNDATYLVRCYDRRVVRCLMRAAVRMLLDHGARPGDILWHAVETVRAWRGVADEADAAYEYRASRLLRDTWESVKEEGTRCGS